MDIKDYISENRQRMLDELFELLRIPSVSADPAFAGDVERCAEAVAASLTQAGASNVEVMTTPGHPIVFGEYKVSSSAPTVLVYGHYDVQPADPIDLWDKPAFEPYIKVTEKHSEGAIFARGSCDDKGQMFMHVKALEAMVAVGNVPCNIKFIIEGEEEVGSSHLDSFLEENKEKLSADVVLVSDTGIISNDTPSITVGLRGLSYVEVEVTGPNRDLHSGLYGGSAPNPINILCEMIASLKDEDQRITIEGFYDDVEELSSDERAAMAKAPFSSENHKSSIGIGAHEGEVAYSPSERMSIRPTLDVNGIWGGYMKDGAKTVIASKAYAKISMRLVPHQDHETITRLFTEHFNRIAPPSVSVKVTEMHGAAPAVTPTNSPAYNAASLAMTETFGNEPVPIRSGGSIPIVASFERILGLKTVLFGFGLDSDAIHSPNEHYGVFNYFKGIETIPLFYKHFSELHED
ncbi:MAG TPA: dipeptidase [Flavobacteriales bacterium]|jgi:acetylornithine deacetylase/succinyl-diaminopimelate desuccinylase-like protein|nr:dipeptidase [Flavobacteriales bacterium]HIN41747.1 dipeptidase [Flavobacteriales bacterium]